MLCECPNALDRYASTGRGTGEEAGWASEQQGVFLTRGSRQQLNSLKLFLPGHVFRFNRLDRTCSSSPLEPAMLGLHPCIAFSARCQAPCAQLRSLMRMSQRIKHHHRVCEACAATYPRPECPHSIAVLHTSFAGSWVAPQILHHIPSDP